MVRTRRDTAVQKDPETKQANTLRTSEARREIKSFEKNGIWYLWLSNIKQALEIRLHRLTQSGKLEFGGHFGGKLFLVFLGDKGGKSTKCAIGIGNVKHSNSADSLLLVSIFDDDDNYTNLACLPNVFDQLQFDHVSVGEEVREVTWFMSGDLKFIDTVYGHLGSAATHPCPICECSKEAFVEDEPWPGRTLYSIEQNWPRHVYNTQDRDPLPAKRMTELNRECRSVTKKQEEARSQEFWRRILSGIIYFMSNEECCTDCYKLNEK